MRGRALRRGRFFNARRLNATSLRGVRRQEPRSARACEPATELPGGESCTSDRVRRIPECRPDSFMQTGVAGMAGGASPVPPLPRQKGRADLGKFLNAQQEQWRRDDPQAVFWSPGRRGASGETDAESSIHTQSKEHHEEVHSEEEARCGGGRCSARPRCGRRRVGVLDHHRFRQRARAPSASSNGTITLHGDRRSGMTPGGDARPSLHGRQRRDVEPFAESAPMHITGGHHRRRPCLRVGDFAVPDAAPGGVIAAGASGATITATGTLKMVDTGAEPGRLQGRDPDAARCRATGDIRSRRRTASP